MGVGIADQFQPVTAGHRGAGDRHKWCNVVSDTPGTGRNMARDCRKAPADNGKRSVFAPRQSPQRRTHVEPIITAGNDLEGKVGDPVAELSQREILKHDISNAAIGWSRFATLCCGDQGINRLCLATRIKPHCNGAGESAGTAADLGAVGPDATDGGDRPGYQCNRERRPVSIAGAATLAAAGGFDDAT